MILTCLFLALGTGAPAPTATAADDAFAIRARRVEVGNGETLESAVILVEGGKIIAVGEDLPIERGIRVIDLDDDQVVMPGLVDAYSRLGLTGGGYNDSRPYILASDEIYPASEPFEQVLEAGVTTLGLYPAGNTIPGQAVAVQPKGESPEDMILRDKVYLKAVMRASKSYKRHITDGFKKADDWYRNGSYRSLNCNGYYHRFRRSIY